MQEQALQKACTELHAQLELQGLKWLYFFSTNLFRRGDRVAEGA